MAEGEFVADQPVGAVEFGFEEQVVGALRETLSASAVAEAAATSSAAVMAATTGRRRAS